MNKKVLWIVGIVLVLAVALVFAACESSIDNGNINVDEEALASLPFTVEVMGLEGVNGTGKVSLMDKASHTAALAAVKEAYYVPDGAVTYAVDIKIVDADGKEIKVGKPVTVTITMKDDIKLIHDSEIFHVHDGKATQLAIAVDGSTGSFTVDSFSPFVLVPKHDHSYGDWTEAVAPTCTEKGILVRSCVCGARETQDVAPRHEVVHHEAVVETCTEDGNVEYFTCTKCGKYFLDAECTQEIAAQNVVVPATGHVDANKDYACDVCGENLCKHTLTFVAAVPVTCTEDGNIAYYRCETCGKYFSDAEGANEITLNSTMLMHMGHIDANEDNVCDKCCAILGEHEHTYGEWSVHHEPDCDNDGLEIRSCACGAIETRAFGKALGHIDANEDNVCDRCGKSLHVHAYGDWATLYPATCTEALMEVRRCECGAIETRTVGEALGHEAKEYAAVPASCTEDGHTQYYYCSRCEKYFADAECTQEISPADIVIKATGHVDKNEDGKCDVCDAELGEAAEVPCTVEAMGAEGTIVVVTVQNVDDDQKEAAIQLAKDAYYFEDDAEFLVVDIAAQGQTGGLVSVRVKLDNPPLALDQYVVLHIHNGAVDAIEPVVDGEYLTFQVESFSPFIFGPKHAHSPGKPFTTKEPTCTEAGEETTDCIKCHKVLKTEILPATGHVDANGDDVCDVCGADLNESPIAFVEGKVFKFDHAEGEGVNNATYATAYADATISFFADNYMEYHEFYGVAGNMLRDNNMVLCGTYALTATEGGYNITLTVTKRYYNDEETMIPFSTYVFAYDVGSATVAITEYPATIYYRADDEATPARYEQPALADNWEDAVIVAAFHSVGATKDHTLPNLDNVLEMSNGAVENDQVTVTIKMASKMQGADAAAQYKALLEEQYYDYAWPEGSDHPETRVNTDDNLFWFGMATDTDQSGYPVLTITIGRFYPAYPDAGIDNFLAEMDITDKLPLFTTSWAMKYRFNTDDDAMIGNIHVQLRYTKGGERHDTDVAAAFRSMLLSTDHNYYEKTVKGKTYLCSEHDQLALRLVVGQGDSIDVYINNFNVFYPAAEIAAYLAGTEDPFRDLDDDSVSAYHLYDNEADNPTGIRLVGTMPATADAHLFISGLQEAYADAGYKWSGFATHLGAEDAETLSHLAWLSPNHEIAVMFAAFNAGEHEFGNVAYYSVSIVNLTKIDPNNKAILTSLHAMGYSTALPGTPYTFNGGVTFMYTNQGTGNESGGMYIMYNDASFDSMFDIGTLDTSSPGERTLRISLKGNADIYFDAPVVVYGLTGITASTTKQKIDGRVMYYSANWKYESEYTVTKYYSSGQSVSVKGNADGITFGDINGAQARQDLTVSCTENGITVSTTVPIALIKAFVFECENVSNIEANNATFAVFAQGGIYGVGAWLNVEYKSRDKSFSGNLYIDAENFYIVRLSPDLDVFGSTFYDLDAEGVWNTSESIALDFASGARMQFTFTDLD